MIVKAISNKRSDIPKRVRDMGYPESDDENSLDISPGRHYLVFAVDIIKSQVEYLVHTDTMNIDTFWWMPAELYEVVDSTIPKGWIKDGNQDPDLFAYPSLFDGKIHDDIIDADEYALNKYWKDIKSDPTFPSQEQIDKLNEPFFREQRKEEYEEKLRLAKERGYEWPQKPDDI